MQQRQEVARHHSHQSSSGLSSQSSTEGSQAGAASNQVEPGTPQAQQAFAQQAQQGQVGPGAELVGERVVVYWEGEEQWFPGVVAAYHPGTGEHRVKYDDGDVGQLLLAEESWMLKGDYESVTAVYPAPAALPRLLHHLRTYSAAVAAGGAGLQPLVMPPKFGTCYSFPAGPRVLWWWPCRPLDLVNDSNMSFGTGTTFGLQRTQEVEVQVWGLTPPPHANLQPAPAAVVGAAAAGGAAAPDPDPGSGNVAEEGGGADDELAAVVHERVPGAWQQLCSFSGKFYYLRNQRVVLGPGEEVQRLRDYPGWHLLRAELVRPQGVLLLHVLPPGVVVPEGHALAAAGGEAAVPGNQQPVAGPVHMPQEQQPEHEEAEEEGEVDGGEGGSASEQQEGKQQRAAGAPTASPLPPQTPAAPAAPPAAAAAAASPVAVGTAQRPSKRPAASAPAAAGGPGSHRWLKRPAAGGGQAPMPVPQPAGDVAAGDTAGTSGGGLGGAAAGSGHPAAGPPAVNAGLGAAAAIGVNAAAAVAAAAGPAAAASRDAPASTSGAGPTGLAHRAAATAAPGAPAAVTPAGAMQQPGRGAQPAAGGDLNGGHAPGVAPGMGVTAAAGPAAVVPAAAAAAQVAAAGAVMQQPGNAFSRARKQVVRCLAQVEVAAEVREAVNCLLVDPQQRQVVVTWAGVLRAAAGAGDVEQVVALLREMVDMDQE